MRFFRSASAIALALTLSSCAGPGNLFGSKKASDNRPVIAASFYPVAEIVQRVASDDVQLLQLTAPGVEPHDSEISAKQLDELAKADVVFFLGNGFQPDLEKAIKNLPASVTSIDLLKSVDLVPVSGFDDTNQLGDDPHVWLDPNNMMEMAITVATEISKIESFTASLSERLNTYISELKAVGDLMDSTFQKCERRDLVTSHDAFRYFTIRANLNPIPINGVDPEVEPSAKYLEQLATFTKNGSVTTIFYEEILPRSFADTLAAAIGAKVESIDAVETISQDDLDAGISYISIMKSNITKIANGLGCK